MTSRIAQKLHELRRISAEEIDKERLVELEVQITLESTEGEA